MHPFIATRTAAKPRGGRLQQLCVCCTGGKTLSIPMPTGYTGFAPAITSAATWYNVSSSYWATYQSVPAGATSFSTVTFITAGVVQLPANAVVSLESRHVGRVGSGLQSTKAQGLRVGLNVTRSAPWTCLFPESWWNCEAASALQWTYTAYIVQTPPFDDQLRDGATCEDSSAVLPSEADSGPAMCRPHAVR